MDRGPAVAIHSATVLKLIAPTPDGWIDAAREQLDEILVDHAHCEKKAAGAAVNLLFRYPEHRFLQAPLAALARDELLHFAQVLDRLDARKVAFGRQRPSAYAGALHGLVRVGEPAHLLDSLLVAGLIEARSCERFQLLSEAISEQSLAAFYRALMASESRHHQVYLELARKVVSPNEMERRFGELAAAEAEIQMRPSRRVRLHSGPCPVRKTVDESQPALQSGRFVTKA
ncbi:MAG: tRNA-(ms[2]io[6]A)-hydroxylase [Myxococcota bacterium]